MRCILLGFTTGIVYFMSIWMSYNAGVNQGVQITLNYNPACKNQCEYKKE